MRMRNHWDLSKTYYYDANSGIIGYSGDENNPAWYIKNKKKIKCPFIIFNKSEAVQWVENSVSGIRR